ncbi:MAG: hypothetical protein VX552_00605 [Chloroflexota bacterium]|jgi:sRNA-binding carbon storage regulator CsrA|nr:hypothetical protein [Chloroflexota bacterium]|tara:strand:- start:970 stop:1116 length:147 start_codon:yes stop_codon:yes gene_type:complete
MKIFRRKIYKEIKENTNKKLENYKSRKDKLKFLNNVFESEDDTDVFLG